MSETHDSSPVADGESDRSEPNMWAFIAPFLAFMLIATFYPKFDQVFSDSIGASQDSAATSEDQAAPESSDSAEGSPGIVLEVNQSKTNRYIVLIGIQVVVACSLLFYFRKTYFEQFPVKISWLSIPVGVIGVVLWVWICGLGIERMILEPMGLEKYVEVRASFSPFRQLPNPALLWTFLILRFTLLAICVPILEELFLRGWLVRYFENPTWWVVSLANLSINSLMVASVYGVLTHPGEAVAAVVWFSLVTWLMVKTGNLWDCVVAHGVTNLLLGIYIVYSGAWHLW